MEKEISIIIPSFKSFDLTYICVKSFEKFRPKDVKNKYIVVENSSETSYRKDIEEISDNVVWVNNDTDLRGSEANADAIVCGLKEADSRFVFFAHCDTCVVSEHFYDAMFDKISCNALVGTGFDNIRINALHISGVFADTLYIPCKTLDYFPTYQDGAQIMDVGDVLTQYCREHELSYFCFPNSLNNSTLVIEEPYGDLEYVDRCLSEEVIFLHLGRGIPKTEGTYRKKGRIGIDGWKSFCMEKIK